MLGFYMKHQTCFFELISISLGHREMLSCVPTAEDWRTLYKMAQQQTLVGVLFTAIERLPAEQRPPREVLLPWYADVEHLKSLNARMNARAVEAEAYFVKNGFRTTILKGQGIATLYPYPERRVPGDIDIWLEGGREKIYEFASRHHKLEGVNYQHIHYHLFEDAEVEVHITPNHLYAPLYNCRLQRYFQLVADEQFTHRTELPDGVGSVSVPTDEFNRFYILLHIYGHLFGEGIGLRQVMDYYYVLRQPSSAESRERTVHLLMRTGMLRFAQAMMWIQQQVFGLEDEFLIVAPDEREGRFVLSEIMLSGNFGKYDERIDRRSHHKLLPRVWNSMKRNLKFVVRYPHEMLWDLPFRTWLWLWRKWHGWI